MTSFNSVGDCMKIDHRARVFPEMTLFLEQRAHAANPNCSSKSGAVALQSACDATTKLLKQSLTQVITENDENRRCFFILV